MQDIQIEMRTDCGDMVIALYPQAAPATVENFLNYLDAGAFVGTSFFRIVNETHPQTGAAAKINVIQGGPLFDRSGHDPALQLFPLPHEPTSQTGLRHRHGALAMGRFAQGQSYGGFYISVGDQPELDAGGKRFPDGQGGAVFGQVVDGLEVIDALMAHAGENEFTDTPVAILSVTQL